VALFLFAAVPCTTRAEEKDAPKPTVDTLKKDLDQLRTDLNLALQKNGERDKDVAELRKQLSNLEKGVITVVGLMDSLQKEQVRISNYLAPGQGAAPEMGSAGVPVPSLEARLRVLEDRLRDTERRLRDWDREVVDLRARLHSRPSLTQDTGSFLLDNSRLAQDATFVINGVAYRVPAMQTRTVTGYQAGPFTYEVLVDGFGAVQPAVNRTLLRNQVYRIFTY